MMDQVLLPTVQQRGPNLGSILDYLYHLHANSVRFVTRRSNEYISFDSNILFIRCFVEFQIKLHHQVCKWNVNLGHSYENHQNNVPVLIDSDLPRFWPTQLLVPLSKGAKYFRCSSTSYFSLSSHLSGMYSSGCIKISGFWIRSCTLSLHV